MDIETREDRRRRKDGKNSKRCWVCKEKKIVGRLFAEWRAKIRVCPSFPSLMLLGYIKISYLSYSVSSSSCRRPKRRVLGLKQDPGSRTTCSEIRSTFPFCFQSCVYSQHSILKIEEAKRSVRCLEIVHLECESQPIQGMHGIVSGHFPWWYLENKAVLFFPFG